MGVFANWKRKIKKHSLQIKSPERTNGCLYLIEVSMGVLEFLIVGTLNGYLWKPKNELARIFCDLMRRKNLTHKQVECCKALGFTIKAERESYD